MDEFSKIYFTFYNTVIIKFKIRFSKIKIIYIDKIKEMWYK